jgi:YgiT-type zinc finger domain-containing protein
MLHTIASEQVICPYCHLGHMRPRMAVYVRQFGETLVNVPNTPAWECDVCHHRQFEPASVQRIEMLVGQAGPPPNHYRPTPDRKSIANTTPKPAKGTKPDSKAKE